ncbi:MAG: pilus assembly protein [Aliidiomarina sp.]|uniref:pilus assembly protein n=1 Tax=Aliidiomarina sp. TaxID=1872439 RepID=UPI0025BA23E3|nr:pilus assembly protein [Aliidiomarina sp.]MCH8502083.1 pilus assembly protein [Aliidiomarina sp.]
MKTFKSNPISLTSRAMNSVRRTQMMGQGMTEYIVVLALVVVAAIGVYSFFGKTVRTQMAGVAKEISGQSAQQEISQAEQAANAASTTANQDYGLANYDDATNSGN